MVSEDFNVSSGGIGMQQRCVSLFVLLSLSLPSTFVWAADNTPWEACQEHLAVAEMDRMLAFRTCFESTADSITAEFDEVVRGLTETRQFYTEMTRADGNYYLIAAASCQLERDARHVLEAQALRLDSGIRTLRALLELTGRYPAQADRLTLWATEHSMVNHATPMVVTLNEGVDQAEYER